MHVLYECGGYMLKAPFRPVWDRAAQPGFALASMGAFLVLEAADHARARGAKPLARLAAVGSAIGLLVAWPYRSSDPLDEGHRANDRGD